jgi:hypothetical protein
MKDQEFFFGLFFGIKKFGKLIEGNFRILEGGRDAEAGEQWLKEMFFEIKIMEYPNLKGR